MQFKSKLQKEQELVEFMIDVYCKGNHSHVSNCSECAELKEYAREKIEKCPFKEEKVFCSNCTVHCYKKDKREEIRVVMKYSGPRMILYRPIAAIKHLISSKILKK